MTGLSPLGSGRNADVFAIDARRVLRRYRDGGDVAAEAMIMSYVGELGFPYRRCTGPTEPIWWSDWMALACRRR